MRNMYIQKNIAIILNMVLMYSMYCMRDILIPNNNISVKGIFVIIGMYIVIYAPIVIIYANNPFEIKTYKIMFFMLNIIGAFSAVYFALIISTPICFLYILAIMIGKTPWLILKKVGRIFWLHFIWVIMLLCIMQFECEKTFLFYALQIVPMIGAEIWIMTIKPIKWWHFLVCVPEIVFLSYWIAGCFWSWIY